MLRANRIAVAAAALVCGGVATAWEAPVETRDGVAWVLNPAAPRDGVIEVALEEQWRLGDGEDELLGQVVSVFEDAAGNLCLLDAQLSELRIYSPDGRLLRSMGRAGEGPGEFQQAMDACALPGGGYGVVQSWPGRIVRFGGDGTPAGTMQPDLGGGAAAGSSFLIAFGAAPVGELLGVLCMNQTFDQAAMRRTHLLGLFDQDGRLVVPILKREDTRELSGGIPLDEVGAGSLRGRWTALPDGKIAAVPEYHGYRIDLIGPDGVLRRVITRAYESVPRTTEEKDRIRSLFEGVARNMPQADIRVEDQLPDILTLSLGPDGQLWALSSRGGARAPDGVVGTYDVFDAEGLFVRQVTVRGEGDPQEDAVVLLGDRLVVVRGLLGTFIAQSGGESAGEEEDQLLVTVHSLSLR